MFQIRLYSISFVIHIDKINMFENPIGKWLYVIVEWKLKDIE